MSTKLQSNAALLRKVARLEAQLQAAKDFIAHISNCDVKTIMDNADMRLRMEQAAFLLTGGDA